MTIWRPKPEIRVKAIGLHWRDGRLLAAEVRDDSGRLKGVRPPGGGIEFGETWQVALRREFREELGVEVELVQEATPLVLENIYEHEGSAGHEVVFAAEVRFPDGSHPGPVVAFREDDGTECVARWFDLEALDRDGVPLFPVGLRARLSR